MGTRQYPYLKTAPPTVNDDSSAGYLVGDTWLDETNDKIYQAIDVSIGAAVWLELGGGGDIVPSSGEMINGKLSVSLSTSDLVIAVKTLAGADPSASDPVYININGTVRSITSALSITIAAGTNWFNSGGSELATLLVPYFVYAIWDSNSSAVALTIGRKPYYRIVASGMSTTTSENHIYGYSGFTDGDDMVNIGYFEATLSGGAGYTWTVPTFTNDNLHSEPTYVTKFFAWSPVQNAFSTPPTVTARYRVIDHAIEYEYYTDTQGTSNGTAFTVTMPFLAAQDALILVSLARDNGTYTSAAYGYIAAASSTATLYSTAAGTSWTGSGTKSAWFAGRCEI